MQLPESLLNKSFSSSKNSRFRNEAKCKTFLVKMSFLHENKKSFSYQRSHTWPRFETEAWGNPEITYCMPNNRPRHYD